MKQTILQLLDLLEKQKFLLCFLVFFSSQFSAQAQPVSFCVSSAIDNGNGVTLNITTENFTDIVSTQFTVEWNPDELELISISNFNTSLGINAEMNFTTLSISNPIGGMVFSWSDIMGQTLPPGAILFSLNFNTSSNSSEVKIGNSIAIIEVSDINGQLVEVETKTGTVNATGGTISGNIFNDTNSDCLLTTGETGLENWILKIENTQNTFFTSSDAEGNFSAFIPLGTYTISIQDQFIYWDACTPSSNFSLNNNGDVTTLEFPVKTKISCPVLELNISSSPLEKCSSNNTYTVDYCNLGTTTATDAYIEVTFDEYLTVTSSPVVFSSLGGNVYSFEVGNIEQGACQNFEILVDVACDAPTGITHCVQAHIFPDTYCAPPDPLWSGASLAIKGECNATNDSIIFTIENKGSQDMIDNSVYIVIEDVIMLQAPSPLDPLLSGNSKTFTFPATGTTYRMEAAQVPFHPGSSMPSATVEGCGAGVGGNLSTGFINQYPQDEGDGFMAIACRENTTESFSNNKEAFPKGYGTENYVNPNTDIEYFIRFENTGTDSVVDLTIRDTLSQFLDASSIRAITSSHPFEFRMTGEGVAVFKFPNINLSSAENGFIQFKVSQLPDVPLETVIENKSAIYFGFSLPVLTNTVFHTIGEQFIAVKTKRIFVPNLTVEVYPNPARDVVHFKVDGLDLETIELKLFDLRGSLIYSATSPNEVFIFYRNELPSGVYAFTLNSEEKLLSTGKLIIE